MKAQMQAAFDVGIDAFAVTYKADEPTWRARLQQMLDNAPVGFSIAVHFEVSLLADNLKNVSSVVQALKGIQTTYVNHPHYFHYQGRPVVYFWWPQGIPGNVHDNWVNVRSQIDPDHSKMIWSVDTIDFARLDAFDTIHYFSGAKWADNLQGAFANLKTKTTAWNDNHPGAAPRLTSSSVTPGVLI